MSRVVIIGGGIAGLAAAHRLTHTAPGLAVTLVESDQRLGGKILTERVNGFVIEGGPDTFLSLKPRGLGLCKELGLESRLHGTNETIRRTYVMRRGQLQQLPEGLTGLIPSRFGPMAMTGLISPLGKLRMGLDFFLRPQSPHPAGRGASDGDESLAAFIERRLGRELYDRLIEPLMGGIYAGDGEQLSLAATFPQLRQAELEHGGLIRGMLAAKKKTPTPRSDGRKWSAFLTPTTGLAEMVEALERALEEGVTIRRGVRAVQVQAIASGYAVELESGESLTADAVILATPAFVTADLISNLDSPPARAAQPGRAISDLLRAIPYVSTATVSLAYPLTDIPRPLDGYGYIVPRAEGRAILACTWTSTKFPHRAPPGYGLMRAFVGRAGQEGALDGTDEDLLLLVREELRRTLGITAPPLLQRIYRWPQAMPQYTLGHLDRLAVIDERLRAHAGLFVAGAAYRGIGLPDCIASGEGAAEKVLAHLRIRSERTPV